MKSRIESREVLAAAYTGPNKHGRRDEGAHGHRRMLRHAVLIEELPDRHEREQLLCNRVSVLSLADAMAGDRTRPPTCIACMRAVRALRRKGLV